MSTAAELKYKANVAKDATKEKAVVVYDKATVLLKDLRKKADETKDKALVIVRDPQFQTCTIATAGGAITVGTAGGAFGLASGVVVGSAAGVVPALFTFGLSIPVGGAMGGAGGLCAGTLVGGASGGVGGFTIYKYRVELKDGLMVVKVKAQDTLTSTKEKTVAVLNLTRTKIDEQVCKIQTSVREAADRAKKTSIVYVDLAKAKSSEAFKFATTTKAGVTSSAAVAGAVVTGAGGACVGTVAGAAVGIVPAIFTFGLSIPVFAVIGGCVGTTVGGTAGAVGGGAVGYGGFTHRKAISECAQSSWSKVSTRAVDIKAKTFSYAADAKKSIMGSTGGSDHEAELKMGKID